MSQMVRCKACGYIMQENKVRGVCPACGFDKKVFEPYKDRISARRSFILNLDLHPILVHFPQAFCTLLPPLVLLSMFVPSFYGQEVLAVIAFTLLLLPVTTVGALASGFIDGKTKLKKLGTPALVQKIVVGTTLLVLSSANAVVYAMYGFEPGATQSGVLLLSVACLICAVLLGMMGKKLINAILPG